MQCEKCKIKRATVFFTELDRTRHAMCSLCAAEQKSAVHFEEESNFSLYSPKSYIYELVHVDSVMYCPQNQIMGDTFCPACKTKLEDVLNDGKMGCASCYTSFSQIAQFMGYGNQYYSKYNEKMPRRYKEKLDMQNRIIKLSALLSDAVSMQRFEEAAKIRDEIKILEDMKKGA